MAKLWAIDETPSDPSRIELDGTKDIRFQGDDKIRLLTVDRETVRLWDWDGKTAEPTPVGDEMRHEDTPDGVAFNRDATQVLTWTSNFVRLWDASGRRVAKIKHENLDRVVPAPDESRILTSDLDGTVRLWSVDAEPVSQLGRDMKHNDSLLGARFSRDGNFILTWSRNGTVRLWDPATRNEIWRQREKVFEAFFIHVDDDESQVLTVNENGARIWRIPGDLDFPPSEFGLQVTALTGTEFDPDTGVIRTVEADEWRDVRERYIETARSHLKHCKYPSRNVFLRNFPEEAATAQGQ